MIKRIGVFFIAVLLIVSLAVTPERAFAAPAGAAATGDPEFASPDSGSVQAVPDEDAPLLPAQGEAGETVQETAEAMPQEGIETAPPEDDSADVPLPENDDSDASQTGAALAEIESLTTDAGADSSFDGYIVQVDEAEVTAGMLEAAPSDLVGSDMFVVETPEEALMFAEPGQIVTIEPNYIVSALDFPQTAPNDPLYSTQWNLNGSFGVNAESAWSRGLNGAGVRVAVLDSGVNAAHEDMGAITEGYKFISGGPEAGTGSVSVDGAEVVKDMLGHGTVVSSIIAANASNGRSIAGLAYGAEIVPYKVMYRDSKGQGSGHMSDVINALSHIAANNDELGIDVVNLSLGTDSASDILNEKIDALMAMGIIVVAAVGNDGNSALIYPAAYEGVIGVGATNNSGVRSSYSQYNASVDVVAPGGVGSGVATGITGLSYSNNTGINIGSGTSYATPLVAAAAALAKQDDASIDNDGFMDLLEATSRDAGNGAADEYGVGLLDAEKLAEEITAEADPVAGSDSRGLVYKDGKWIIYVGPDDIAYTGWGEDFDPSDSELNGRYFDGEKGRVSGLFTVDGLSLYFDNVTGKVLTGFVKIGSYTYYYEGKAGKRVNCEIVVDRETGLVAASEDAASGTVIDISKLEEQYPNAMNRLAWHLLDEAGRSYTGWSKDKTKYYDQNGRASGAKKIGSYFYYFDRKSGVLNTQKKLISDRITIAGETITQHYVCYSIKGYLRTGKFSIRLDPKDPDKHLMPNIFPLTTFYADTKTAALVTGQVKIGKYYYYFDGSEGLTLAGERQVGGRAFYYRKSDGARLTGWVTFSNSAKSTVGVPKDGSHESGDKVYYDAKAGLLKTGAKKIGKYWYWLDKDTGALARGEEIETSPGVLFYYRKSDGARLTGWVTFSNSAKSTVGVPKDGSHKSGDKVYYDAKAGLLKTGAKKIGKYWYWLDKESGALWTKKGAVPADPRYYCYSVKGYLKVSGEQKTSDGTYYYGKNGERQSGPVKIGSYIYYYDRDTYLKVVPDVNTWQYDEPNAKWYLIKKGTGRLATGEYTFKTEDEPGDVGVRVFLHKTTGELFTGSVKIGSRFYYYNNIYGRVTEPGWIVGDEYYAGSGGSLVTGRKTVDGKVYYFNASNAKLFTGHILLSGKHYYYRDKAGGGLVTERGWLEDEKKPGAWYYCYDARGYLRTGKGTADDGNAYYFNTKTALLQTGQIKVGKYYYYFYGKDVGMVKGEEIETSPGIFYYYRKSDGARLTGWVTFSDSAKSTVGVPNGGSHESGDRVYYDAKAGLLQNGAKKIGSYWYWLDPDKNGRLQTELKWTPDNNYYVYSKKGYLRTGRQDNRKVADDGKMYYFDTKAKLFTGEAKIGNYYYYFDGHDGMVKEDERVLGKGGKGANISDFASSAEAQTGGNKVYYYKADGKRASGWVTFSKKAAENSAARSVLRDEGDKAYYTSSGIVFGPRKIGSYYYFFDRREGVLERSSSQNEPHWIADGANRYLTMRTDGRLAKSWQKIGADVYYFSAAGKLYINCEKKISGAWYLFDEEGCRATQQWETFPDGRRVYYGSNGVRYSGEKSVPVDGVNYYFYFNTTNGGLLVGKEQKVGNYYKYYRAAGEESGAVYDKSGVELISGFPGAPNKGPAGSRVTGWWKMRSGDLKYYDPAAGGRRLTGRVKLPVYYDKAFGTSGKDDVKYYYNHKNYYLTTEKYSPSAKEHYFLSSKGTVVRSSSGKSGSYLWETDAHAKVTMWKYISVSLSTMKGVDVSGWQGAYIGRAIDWRQVANSGISFALIRAGWFSETPKRDMFAGATVFQYDRDYVRNVKEAQKYGIIVGTYIYTYASRGDCQTQGINEFHNYNKSNGIKLNMPVFLDLEDSAFKNGTDAMGGNSYRTILIRSGMNNLRSLGYRAGIYCSLSWANDYFDTQTLIREGATLWLAWWRSGGYNTPTWRGGYPGVWQYTSSGSVPGIHGRVDMNYIYPEQVNWG